MQIKYLLKRLKMYTAFFIGYVVQLWRPRIVYFKMLSNECMYLVLNENKTTTCIYKYFFQQIRVGRM